MDSQVGLGQEYTMNITDGESQDGSVPKGSTGIPKGAGSSPSSGTLIISAPPTMKNSFADWKLKKRCPQFV